MSPKMTEAAINECLTEISSRLSDASAIAKAALTCAEEGNADDAIKIALDVEQLIHEASTLLNAASLMNRLSDEPPAPARQDS
jgi:hypothetical protein